MLLEIQSAVDFLSRILRKSACLTKDQINTFGEVLKSQLVDHYSQHWYPDHPLRFDSVTTLLHLS